MPDSLNYQTLIQSAVGYSLAVYGFWWARTNGAYFAERSEIKFHINELTKTANEFVNIAIDYWTSDEDETAALKAAKIIRLKSSMEERLVTIGYIDNAFVNHIAFRNFARVVTGGTFQTKARKKVAASDEKINEILGAASELITALERSFQQRYKIALKAYPSASSLKNKLFEKYTERR